MRTPLRVAEVLPYSPTGRAQSWVVASPSRRSAAFFLGLALVLLWSLLQPVLAHAQEATGEVLRNGRLVQQLLGSRASRLSASAGPDPDTVYVGKSFTNHTGPGNYWNIYTGKYLPGLADPANAMWDWDNSVGIQTADSLQGWWPMRRQYNSTGGLTLTDDQRPWWAIDHGNLANYVISQQSAAKRTFGVVGIWHSDPGKNAGQAVPWTPLSGARSAWCGLRQHADNVVVDAVTGNPFTQDIVHGLHDGTTAGGGSANRFPGYPDQIDQMLYRDIAMTNSQSLTVSFKYRTRMSTSITTNAAARTGWFHGDPLAVVAGNFISSSAAGVNAPQDSFMVYVGAPVSDAACVYSDGTTRPVYDKQRRWFSEVLKVFGAGSTYYEIFKAAGNNPADTLDATPSASVTIPAAHIAAILSPASSGSVRLVFRCKTNRGFADSDSRNSLYTSFGYGAVLIDDIAIDRGAGPELIGDFEGVEQGGVNQIDNRFPLPPSLQSTDVWRSTGKPPAEYFHVEHLSGLTYNDLCGPPDSPARLCNIGGLILTPGNHDDGEGAGDSRFAAFREISHIVTSPTINLVGEGPGRALPNAMGITNSIAAASNDIVIWYDIYAGMFNLQFSGQTWSFGSQSYPATQVNGAKVWGQPRFPAITVFNPEPQCFTDFEPFIGNGSPLLTSNPSGIPDSLRFWFAHQQQCFRFNITLGCNSNEGGYFDNATLAFIDLPGVPGQASGADAVAIGGISGNIWDFTHDTFPANETPGLPGTAAFDTAGALIRTGLNTAQATSNPLRFDIPGDSTVVFAGNATVSAPDDVALAPIRVDLVFRVLPGPGNYQIAAGRSMSPGGVPSGVLLQVPQDQGAVVTPGDASFWGQYMAAPGEVSAGSHGSQWSPLVWNSARCDTAQLKIFPVGGAVPTGTGLASGVWMTMYHELDPKFATLGVDKFWCFVIDTTKAGNGTNVVCNGTVPAWLTTVPQSRTGWNGSATTKEFTKILPDGLLTPGAHVQYFFRKSHHIDPFVRFAMVPDTNFITPQNSEGSTDQHRWQQFSVLPDRWKAAAFGGEGRACMLYIDLNDRRGNEGRFVSTMDSIGSTVAAKRGSHNGWTAPGTTNITSLDVRTNAAVRVSDKNSQPGSTWDMYGVKASESLTTSSGSPGNRLANRAGLGLAAGREARMGPTPEMLRAYYRIVAILSGDLSAGVLGPFTNRSQNDIALFNDFLLSAGGTIQPRGILVQGNGFGQSEKAAGGIDPSHTLFLTEKLGAVFRNTSYQSLSGNTNVCADVITTTNLTSSADVYGVANQCTWSNDVWQRNPAISESQDAAFYSNAGLNGPYVSDVVKPATLLRNWVAWSSGYEIEHLYGRYCDSVLGRQQYYFHAINKVFGGICQLTGSSCLCLDTPQSQRLDTSFMKIGNSVMRDGHSTVRFGVPQQGRVQVVLYDVTGRRVRQLADRVFPAGEHVLQWDGSDDTGTKLARGVYFVRSNLQGDAKRVVVLN